MGLMPGLLIQRRSPCGTEAAAGDLVCLSVGAFSVRRAHTQYFFWPFWVEVLLLHVCYPGSMTAPIVEYNSGVLVKEFQVTRGCDVDCVQKSICENQAIRSVPIHQNENSSNVLFPVTATARQRRAPPPTCLHAVTGSASGIQLPSFNNRPSTSDSAEKHGTPSATITTSDLLKFKTQARSVAVYDCAAPSSTPPAPPAARPTQAISLIIRRQNVHDRYRRFNPISKLISLRPLRKLLVSSREHAMARGGTGGDAPNRTPATCVRSSHMSSS